MRIVSLIFVFEFVSLWSFGKQMLSLFLAAANCERLSLWEGEEKKEQEDLYEKVYTQI
jgi:hypothetical protein